MTSTVDMNDRMRRVFGPAMLTAALAMPTGAIMLAAAPSAVAAEPTAIKRAGCQVHAVLASKDGDGEIPRSLEFLRETLKDDQFAAFKSFHLVDKKTMSLTVGKVASAALTTGHQVKVTLLESDPKRLRLHLDLTARDGEEPLVRTDYSIEHHGLFMIQAGRYKQEEVSGKLLFAFQCAAAQ